MMRLTFFVFAIAVFSCAKTPIESIWDYPSDAPLVRFVDQDVLPASLVGSVSKFRSAAGHDYSDIYESNRSMKHYFYPTDTSSRTQILKSPIKGFIHSIVAENLANSGSQIKIVSSEHPEYTVVIFHVGVSQLHAGDFVYPGTTLGTNASISFDVAVWRKDGRLVSWFDVITDRLFSDYIARGATQRSDFMISKSYRDANPISSWSTNDSSNVFTLF